MPVYIPISPLEMTSVLICKVKEFHHLTILNCYKTYASHSPISYFKIKLNVYKKMSPQSTLKKKKIFS